MLPYDQGFVFTEQKERNMSKLIIISAAQEPNNGEVTVKDLEGGQGLLTAED